MGILKTRDGTGLYYKEWGEGRPIVLIHGWPLNADMWDGQAVDLAAQGFRVVAYDRRGFGRSEQPFRGYDYDTLSDDLADLLEGLDLRDSVLVGFSMGGGEVARFLGRHGTQRVGKAILVSAVTPFMLKTDDNPDGLDGSTFDGFVDSLREDRPHFLSGFGKKFYGAGLLNSPVSDEYLGWTSAMALQAGLAGTLACVDAFGRTDFRPDMAAFTVPTLIVHGTGDEIVPFEGSAAKAHEMIAGSVLLAYEDAPHGLHATHKDRLTTDIAEFARA